MEINNGKKLSIIIPYYETYEMTEKLLKELSIQSTRDIEVLLFDDGCSEKRFNIYDGYNGIKVIHQENMGVAKTRNKGIDMAQGKYIAFIDSDDQITMDYVETLLKAIDTYDTDIINFNWYDMTEHIEIRKPDNPAVWKAIYKKDKILKFAENEEYGHEDYTFNCEMNAQDYTIAYLDKLLYLYNSNREGSLIWKKIHKED